MRNGEVQIARWSRRMFRKNFLSSEGVGDAHGVGDVAGSTLEEFCAYAVTVLAAMMRRDLKPRDRQVFMILLQGRLPSTLLTRRAPGKLD